MALTPPGDLYVGVNDSIFPKALAAIQAQRPSLLNYATTYFATRPNTWCVPVKPPPNGAPLMTIIKPIQVADAPIPSVELLVQITGIAVGFGVDTVGLPQPLPPQHVAVKLSFASRLSIPQLDPATIGCPDDEPFKNAVFPMHLCPCFMGDLFLTAIGNIKLCGQNSWVTFALDQFTTTNITPPGLQETVDFLIVLLADTTVLPKMWIQLKPYVIDLSKALPPTAPIKTITISLGAPSALPNPNIANDLLEARLMLKVTTP